LSRHVVLLFTFVSSNFYLLPFLIVKPLLVPGGFYAAGLKQLLLDLCNATCTYCAATFADSEAKTVFHSDWLDESYCHLSVIARHDHLCTFWKCYNTSYVSCTEVELWTVVVEEWSVTTAFIL
jgi:hypothetical protein